MPGMLIKNATALVLDPPSIEQLDLRITRGKIAARGKDLPAVRGEEVHDLRGRIIMPGLVNAHTHLYSALSLGMAPPAEAPQNFLEILQKVWWRLDRALDEESVYYSALIGAIDAARCGTTTLVDHHSSPCAVKGSLDLIKEAVAEIGLRGVLCYEVTDRGGMKERDRGLEENERFIRANRRDDAFRGMVGAHAAFTLGAESLRLVGEMAEKERVGVHIHVAEDRIDTAAAEEDYRTGVTGRLSGSGILRKDSVLAHCVHLGEKDLSQVRKSGCWIVHNPRSNMNNRVGHAPLHLFGERSALGTDGFPPDMFAEAAAGFFGNQEAEGALESVSMTGLLGGGQRAVSGIFGQKFGTLGKGSPADLIVLDYRAPTPMTEENLAGHFLFGMRSSDVESVMVGGRWVVKNRVVVGINLASAYEKAARAAKKLWKKM
jgi:putative selenium metabolism protein SsnA